MFEVFFFKNIVNLVKLYLVSILIQMFSIRLSIKKKSQNIENSVRLPTMFLTSTNNIFVVFSFVNNFPNMLICIHTHHKSTDRFIYFENLEPYFFGPNNNLYNFRSMLLLIPFSYFFNWIKNISNSMTIKSHNFQIYKKSDR